MSKPIFALALIAITVMPLASASQTFTSTLIAGYPQPGTPEGVLVQATDNYKINLAPGDTITVDLNWVPATEQNDLDLVLIVPSAAPVPLPIPPTDPVGTGTALAGSTAVRMTCADMAAKSIAHSGTSEHITYTVPAGGESGTYTLNVRGFLLLSDQTYTLNVDSSNGRDATQDVPSAFITRAPHCQLA